MICKVTMINSYRCPYCPYMTTRMFNFKRHCREVHKIVVKKDHDSEIGQERHVTYHCPNCNFMTKRFNDLKRHVKVIHNILIKHPQDLTSQLNSENLNIKSRINKCHEEKSSTII